MYVLLCRQVFQTKGVIETILFQNVFYTMISTAIGFYLPAALVSFIYYKLFMVFREDLALIIRGLKCSVDLVSKILTTWDKLFWRFLSRNRPLN